MVRLLIALGVLFAASPLAAEPAATAIPSRMADGSTDICYAPCALHWDAHNTTHSTLTGDDVLFGLDYSWDFGDPNAGAWTTTGHSRNAEGGFIAAHVYTAPGVYNVRLTVTDHNGATDTWTDQVVVSDPNDLTTYCFSNDADFAGCPRSCPSSNCVQTNSVATIASYFASNRRLLLERGDSFSGDTLSTRAASAVRLGVYGSGVRPTWVTSTDRHGIEFDHSSNDIAVSGIEFDGHGTSSGVKGLFVKGDHHLVYDNKIHGYQQQVTGDYSSQSNTPDYLVIAGNKLGAGDRTAKEGSGYMLFGQVDHGAAIGNTLGRSVGGDQTEVEHLFRWGWYPSSLIAHNSLGHGYIKHTTKLHDSQGWGSYYWVYRDNTHTCDEVWCAAFGPQASSWGFDERTWYGLIENNYFVGTDDDVGPGGMDVGIITWASHIAIRNNICDATPVSGDRGIRCVSVNRKRDAEPEASAVRVYNNTMHRGGNPSGASTGVSLDADSSEVRNNLLYATGSGKETAASCTGQGNICTHNLNAASNPFAASTFDHPTDFQLRDADQVGDARNEGASIPNTADTDFLDGFRPAEGQWDIGAFEYGAFTGSNPGPGDHAPPDPPILLP